MRLLELMLGGRSGFGNHLLIAIFPLQESTGRVRLTRLAVFDALTSLDEQDVEYPAERALLSAILQIDDLPLY